MGLDGVEIILRVEELFGIEIGDEDAAKVETVGEFYELICSKLNVTPFRSPVTSEVLPVITRREKVFLLLERHKPLPAPAGGASVVATECLGLCCHCFRRSARITRGRDHL